MKKYCFAAIFLFALLFAPALPLHAGGLIAFPGAEGFGRFATGGRGGTIYHVTNLNDSGTGSFRDAISAPNRIIVFDVSGVIRVSVGNPLIFENNLTILGQTAPGEGVQIYGERVSFSGADNIIVRHMRIRMGVGGTSGKDAAGVANGKNMIFDHMSVLWGRDENFSVSWDSKGTEPGNITIQNSIIGQGLQTHSCGGLVQTDGGVTLFRNLYIENKTRNPKVKGLNQYVNNVVYNWGNGGCYIMGDTEAESWAHIENNYFINGPWQGSTDPFTRGTPTFRYYGKGNYWDADADGLLDGELMSSGQYSGSTAVTDFNTWDNSTTRPQAHPVISSMKSASDALAWIVDSVGPSLPVRDQVDQYLINELKSYGKIGTTGGITTERTLPHGGTGVLYGGFKPADADGDAIPDAWETANGLNPNNAADAAAIAANGYANIENYSFSIVSAYPYVKAPSGGQLKNATTSSLTLSFADNSNDETSFVVEQSTNGTDFTVLTTLPADSTLFSCAGLQQVKTYYFRVKAIRDDLNSPYSSVFKAATLGDPTIPVACSSPTPSDSGSFGIASALKLSWSNATTPYGGTLYYSVYMGSRPDSLKLLADSLTVTTYTHGMVPADTTFYWRVDTRNTMGLTAGTVWSFRTVPGGQLFYTDFNSKPAEFYTKFGSNATQRDLINAANATASAGGIVIGSGANSIRVVYMMTGAPTSSTSDYGPYTAADAGSTDRAIQFYTKSSGGYVRFPEVQGPCVISIWTGNPEAASTTYKLNTIINGTETNVASYTMAAAKRSFKNQFTYLGKEKVVFKIDANGKKMNVNDVLIESFVPALSDDPITIVSSPDTANVSYMDGAFNLVFNQTVAYHGGALINGEQFEQISVTGGGGTGLQVNVVGLAANTEYTIQFPEGALTDFYETKTNAVEFNFKTSEFLPAKVSGETHFGKAALSLPLSFKPFNVVAPFTTSGGLVQTSAADFPHWISAAGGITSDSVKLTSTSDKLMAYFDQPSKKFRLSAYMAGSGTVTLKVQESRNPDGTPGWRTIRQMNQTQLPVDMDFYLDETARFIKVVPTAISGTLVVKDLIISDGNGNFPTALMPVQTSMNAICWNVPGGLIINGLKPGMMLCVTDAAGRTVQKMVVDVAETQLDLKGGFYLIHFTDGLKNQVVKAVVPR